MKHKRIWWQKPKRYANQEFDRKVSYLELFYDLIYVAMIAQLSHKLAIDVSWASFGKFTFLFTAVWWGWFNGAMYHDLHGNDDIKTRIITFVQMFTVAGMAVFVHNAFLDGAIGFSITYSVYLSIIMVLWYRTGVHDPNHRPLATPYSVFYLISIILMLLSIFVEPPVRFYLWYMSLFVIVTIPLSLTLLARKIPQVKVQISNSNGLSPSIVERFGLLTIIVLGEVVVGVVNGLISHHHLNLMTGLVGFLAMSMAVGIWWVYFDFIANQEPQNVRMLESAWGYLHLPLTLGITVVGAATLNIVTDGDNANQVVRLLLAAGISIVYLTIATMFFTVKKQEDTRLFNRVGQFVTTLAGILSITLYFLPIQTHTLLFWLDITMLAPVYFGFRVWIKHYLRKQK